VGGGVAGGNVTPAQRGAVLREPTQASLLEPLRYFPESLQGRPGDRYMNMQERYLTWLRLVATDARHPVERINNLPRQQADVVRFLELAFISKAPGPADPDDRVGCILNEAYGTSKMATVFAFAEMFCSRNDRAKIMIVVPDISLDSWRRMCIALLPDPNRIKVVLLDASRMTAFHGNVSHDLDNWRGVLIIALSVMNDLLHGSLTSPKAVKTELISPGADIVFFDEAHRLRMLDQTTMRMLRRVSTRCRVAITCAPLSSNLYEYWSMLDWTIPGLFGTLDQFSEVFVRRIVEGQRLKHQVLDSDGRFVMNSERSKAYRAAWLLSNRILTVAFPVCCLPVLPIDALHMTLFVHLDPIQAQCYIASATVVEKAVDEKLMDPSIGALILQMAATHTHALKRFIKSLVDFRSRGDEAAPILICMGRAREALRLISTKIDEVLACARPIDLYPSSKLLVVNCLFQECRKGKERMVVFTQSEEVWVAMHTGLKVLNGSDDVAIFQVNCLQNSSDRDRELAGWSQCQSGAVMITMIGPSSDYAEIAGWTFPETARIVLLDCSWSMSCTYQALARITPERSRRHPIHVYSLVAAATCERLWEGKHDSDTVSPMAGDKGVFAYENSDYLVDREISRSALNSPPPSWDYEMKPLNKPRLSSRAAEMRPFLDGAAESAILALADLHLASSQKSYALFEISIPARSKPVRSYQFLTQALHAITRQDRDLACKEYEVISRDYRAKIGATMWRGLEERVERDSRAGTYDFSDGVDRQHAIIPPAAAHMAGCQLPLYELIRPYWDLYSRPYMPMSGGERRGVRETEGTRRQVRSDNMKRLSPRQRQDQRRSQHRSSSPFTNGHPVRDGVAKGNGQFRSRRTSMG
jgi:SNF2-related domain